MRSPDTEPISRAVAEKGAIPPRTPPIPGSQRRGHIGITELAIGAGVVTTTAAGAAIAINAFSPHRQGPDHTFPAIVEPSLSPTPEPITPGATITIPSAIPTEAPTPSPTPEAIPGPVYTFPGDLESFTNKQIYAKNIFSSGNGGHLPLNIIGEIVVQPSEEYDQLQAYELGNEVVDGHLINYFGFKDGVGGQYFFPVDYGRMDSTDKVYLDYPRSAFIDPNMKQGYYTSVNEAKKILDKNIGNSIIFSLFSFDNPGSGGTRSSQDLKQQSPIALEIMKWSLQVKNASYTKVPMDTGISKIINQRITAVKSDLIPGAFQISPYQKP